MSLYAKSEKDDINSLMPLLLAAHPEFKPSFKKMAEMDAKHKVLESPQTEIWSLSMIGADVCSY